MTESPTPAPEYASGLLHRLITDHAHQWLAELGTIDGGKRLALALLADYENLPPKARLPIPMVLHCPECRARHVDVGEFATKPHHTHACQSCGMVWRPAIGPTVGVQFLPGFKNEEPEQPAQAKAADLIAAATKLVAEGNHTKLCSGGLNEACDCPFGDLEEALRGISQAPELATPPAPAAERPAVVTAAMIDAASASRARDDEGEFPPLCELIDFSGENKTRTVIRAALEAALLADQAEHPAVTVLRELVACVEADSRGPRFEAAMESARALLAGSGGGQ